MKMSSIEVIGANFKGRRLNLKTWNNRLQGFTLSDLDDKGRAQVCSQIGRRFSSLFKKLGNEGEINLGSFSLQRKSQKMAYASGKTENATVYLFNAFA